MTVTKLKVRLYGDPCLRQFSQAIEEVGPSERMLIAAMVTTMHYQKGIGLAAPQVGINRQLFVVDIGDGPFVFINPEIIQSSGCAEMEEGCLSIPNVNIIVERSEKITVRYIDENNQSYEDQFEGLLARVIQHETDHLHGKMIVDYATEEELKKFDAQLKELVEKSK